MSHFRRHRSRVFWGQMRSRDAALAEPPPLAPGAPPRLTAPARSGATAEDEPPARRSLSPATSRGQRSQDSGFSDSGRSDSSGTSGLQSPERRRRRRRSGRGARGRGPAARPGPAHTSTPKRIHGHTQATHEEEQPASPNPAEPEEHLGDFLFADEPAQQRRPARPRPRAPQPPPQPRRPAVRLWLRELRGDAEDECTATLQSKCLPGRRAREREPAEARDRRPLAASATTAAKRVLDAADGLERRYQQVLRSIGASGRPDADLLATFEAEAAAALLRLGAPAPPLAPRPRDPPDAAARLALRKSAADRALERRLDCHVEELVGALDGATRGDGRAARGALAALTALGLAGPRAGASVARCAGVRALLTALVSAPRGAPELRCAALRALASVCCCAEAVEQLARDGGAELLAEALEAAASRRERAEAAALLVQVTAPWVGRAGVAHLEALAPRLVRALTELAEAADGRQALLLAAAGLNHLAGSRRCVAAIVGCGSIKRLLRCVKKSNGGDVCLMEQVASLVGQVARVPQARAHLAESRASVALVCFLRMQPPGLEDEYRRLAETTSEALTRLCVDPEIAKQVVAVGGSDFLPGRDDEEPEQRFRSTRSLRVARKIAAQQIDIARIWDHSPN